MKDDYFLRATTLAHTNLIDLFGRTALAIRGDRERYIRNVQTFLERRRPNWGNPRLRYAYNRYVRLVMKDLRAVALELEHQSKTESEK